MGKAPEDTDRNFKEDILEAVGSEEIVGVVIGEFGWLGRWGEELGYEEEHKPFIPWEKRGRVLTWEEAAPLLDYEYDDSFGAPDCHAVYIWTDNRKGFFIGQNHGL